MASGTIYFGTSGQIEGRIVWSSTSNGTDSNSSNVSASIQVQRTNSASTTGTWTGYLSISSKSENFSYYGSIADDWVTLKTLSFTKSHNSDGTGDCYIAGRIQGPSGTTQANSIVSGSKTVELDTIPREGSILTASSFNDEENPKITYDNPAGSGATTLQACIADTSGNVIVAYRNVSKTGSSYTFNLTNAERTALRNACPDANSMSVRFYLNCVIGSTNYRSYLTRTMTIVNANPTLNPTAVDTGSVSTVLTGDINKIIKGYNVIEVSSGAAAIKGATIKSQKITCGGDTLTSGSGKFYYKDTSKIVFSVTDSRGNTTTQTLEKPFVNYVKLTCNFVANISTSGILTLTINGNYFNGSFGATDNTLEVKYRIKFEDGTYGPWSNLTPTLEDNKYSATIQSGGYDYQATYYCEAIAYDKINSGGVSTGERTLKALPVFDWSKEDFAFHVPVYIDNGKRIYAKTADGNAALLMVSINASDQSFFGYGGYEQSIGSTYFDGNAVNIRSRNNIANTASGTIGGNKAWTNSSDSRLKENIEQLPQAFCDIWLELQPKMFEWNSISGADGKKHFGLVAQDVIKAFQKQGLDYKQYGFVEVIPIEDVEYFALTYEAYNMITAQVLKNTINEVSALKNELAEIKALIKQEV